MMMADEDASSDICAVVLELLNWGLRRNFTSIAGIATEENLNTAMS